MIMTKQNNNKIPKWLRPFYQDKKNKRYTYSKTPSPEIDIKKLVENADGKFWRHIEPKNSDERARKIIIINGLARAKINKPLKFSQYYYRELVKYLVNQCGFDVRIAVADDPKDPEKLNFQQITYFSSSHKFQDYSAKDIQEAIYILPNASNFAIFDFSKNYNNMYSLVVLIMSQSD